MQTIYTWQRQTFSWGVVFHEVYATYDRNGNLVDYGYTGRSDYAPKS